MTFKNISINPFVIFSSFYQVELESALLVLPFAPRSFLLLFRCVSHYCSILGVVVIVVVVFFVVVVVAAVVSSITDPLWVGSGEGGVQEI